MADLFTSTLADAKALLNILLTVDGRWLVTDKANEEVKCCHQENSNGTPTPLGEISLKESDWNQNHGVLGFLEHYRKYILGGLKKGVPKHKNLNMIQFFSKSLMKALLDF